MNNTYQICCGLSSCLAPNRPVISRGGSRSCSRAAAGGGSLSDASGPVKCCVTGARRRRGARSSEHRSPRGAWGRNETRAQSSPSRERSCPPARRLHPSPKSKKSYLEENPVVSLSLVFCAVTACGFDSQCVFTSDSLSLSSGLAHALSTFQATPLCSGPLCIQYSLLRTPAHKLMRLLSSCALWMWLALLWDTSLNMALI